MGRAWGAGLAFSALSTCCAADNEFLRRLSASATCSCQNPKDNAFDWSGAEVICNDLRGSSADKLPDGTEEQYPNGIPGPSCPDGQNVIRYGNLGTYGGSPICLQVSLADVTSEEKPDGVYPDDTQLTLEWSQKPDGNHTIDDNGILPHGFGNINVPTSPSALDLTFSFYDCDAGPGTPLALDYFGFSFTDMDGNTAKGVRESLSVCDASYVFQPSTVPGNLVQDTNSDFNGCPRFVAPTPPAEIDNPSGIDDLSPTVLNNSVFAVFCNTDMFRLRYEVVDNTSCCRNFQFSGIGEGVTCSEEVEENASQEANETNASNATTTSEAAAASTGALTTTQAAASGTTQAEGGGTRQAESGTTVAGPSPAPEDTWGNPAEGGCFLDAGNLDSIPGGTLDKLEGGRSSDSPDAPSRRLADETQYVATCLEAIYLAWVGYSEGGGSSKPDAEAPTGKDRCVVAYKEACAQFPQCETCAPPPVCRAPILPPLDSPLSGSYKQLRLFEQRTDAELLGSGSSDGDDAAGLGRLARRTWGLSAAAAAGLLAAGFAVRLAASPRIRMLRGGAPRQPAYASAAGAEEPLRGAASPSEAE